MQKRRHGFSRLIAFSIFAVPTAAIAQFVTTATPTIQLDMTGTTGSEPMNIAWDSVTDQYYGGRGGNSSYSFRVWNASGSTVQTLTPGNIDLRSFYYNSNVGAVEVVAYNAKASGTSGFQTVGRTGGGLLTGSYTPIGVSLSGLPTSQVVPAFDAARNVLYAFDSGSSVTVVSRDTGLATSTLTLNLASAGATTLMSYSIGYDPQHDALISFTSDGGNRALDFDATTGAFKASVSLPGLNSPASVYSLGFANKQLFVYDAGIGAYRGYSLIPEPSIMSLLGVGLGALAFGRWQRRLK